MPWDRAFDDPIEIPGSRKKLLTLRDAANYITKLPKAEYQADEWQGAIQALMLLADDANGPTMFARLGMTKALSRKVERVFDPLRKDTQWGRRKLVRGA